MQRLIIAVFAFMLMPTLAQANADVQRRITIFTQQAELFRQICFQADGTFLQDQIIFDQSSSISETAIDCNAQAFALEQEKLAIEAILQDDECPTCYDTINDQGLIDLLNGQAGVVGELTCPGIGDANQCMSGLACNLITSVIPMAGAVRNTFRNHPVFAGCGSSGGNCFSNIGKAIWDNLWDTVVGIYDLAAMGVSWVGDQLGSLFAAEDATSSRGIAATEVSESQLDQFLADPVAYLYNLGGQLMSMIANSISSRYGCAEWTGVPHLSECTRPMSWECASCDEKLNMVCGVTGYVGATIVTTFFTGGATAMAQIGSKLATTSVIAVARSIPGAARIAETMAVAGRLSRGGAGLLTGTIRQVWNAVRTSRSAQAIGSVANQLRAAGAAANGFAQKRIFLYARTQTAVIEAARAYNRLSRAAFNLGYRTTGETANATQTYLYAQYTRFSDVRAGRIQNVTTAEDFLRESVRRMPAADRQHMRYAITTDAAGEQRILIYDSRAGRMESGVSFDFNPSRPPPPPVAPVVAAAAPTEIAEIVVTGTRRPPNAPPLYLDADAAARTFDEIEGLGVDLAALETRPLTREVADALTDNQRIYILEDMTGQAFEREQALALLANVERRTSQGSDVALFTDRQARVRATLEASGMPADEAAAAAERLFTSGALGRTPPPEQIRLIVRSTQAAPSPTLVAGATNADNALPSGGATRTLDQGTTPPVPQTEFMDSWATRTATNRLQNEEYIRVARLGRQPGLFHLDTQNTALKYLNDNLRNKSLVDAIGNRYNSMVQDALEEFRRAHPGVSIDSYSDYKSFRAAIRGPPGQEDALMAELSQIMDRTNAAFVDEIRRSNYVNGAFLQNNWFRSGIGRTADEANLVTRFSRRDGDATTTIFDSEANQTRITNAWQVAQTTRAQLANRFRDTPLLRTVEGTNSAVPTSDVLEVVRKNSDDVDVARILSGRYGVDVTPTDALRLRIYFDQVDQFSPGLMIAQRVEHRFDQATEGGFSIDFAGVGSLNAEATAIGLTEGNTLLDAIAGVRRREIAVTERLDALKDRTEKAMREVLGRHGIEADITVSGDDMLVVPNRALTPAIQRELAEAQARAAGDPSGIRASFFPRGIPDQASRSIQATIGETVEKKLRKRLEGLLPQSDLRQTLFAVDMRGTSPGTGGVGLDIVNPNLSPQALQTIQREFNLSINDINAELKSSGQAGDLSLAP